MGAAVAESEFAAGRFWNARACAFVRSKSLDYHHILVFDAGDMLRITLLISSAVVLLDLAHSVEKSLRHKMDAHELTDTQRLSRYLFTPLWPCVSGRVMSFQITVLKVLGWTSRRTGVARRPQTGGGNSDF